MMYLSRKGILRQSVGVLASKRYQSLTAMIHHDEREEEEKQDYNGFRI